MSTPTSTPAAAVGKELRDLELSRIVPGNLFGGAEQSTSSLFSGNTRIMCEEKTKTYNMVIVRACSPAPQTEVGVHHVLGEHALGSEMTMGELENGLIGNFMIVEKMFKDGDIVVEEETKREYTVDVVVGTTRSRIV